MFFESLWKELALVPETEAIALGGSRAGTQYDEKSDYDLYVYCTRIPERKVRKQILEKYCRYMELENSFWETEDDCTLKNGVDIDILYRNMEGFLQDIHSVVKEHTAHNGYTTCMWHNLLHSRILYDKNGKLAEIQREYDVPYPDELREHIIRRNLRLLTGNLPSYDRQIRKAIARKDWVSVNHRTAVFLESYFDIIFAFNKLTHPGEKHMVRHAKEQAEMLPANFEENLNCLLAGLFTDSDGAGQTLASVILELEKVLETENYV